MSGTRKVPQLPQPIETTRQETLKWVAASAPGLAVDDAELGTSLFAGSVRLVRTVDSHLQRYGLSSGRFAVLITLGAAPEGRHTPSAIAERIAVRRPTVTGIVNGLESAGLVRRSADPTSRRNQLVELTERGRRLVAEIAPDHFGRLAAAMGSSRRPNGTLCAPRWACWTDSVKSCSTKGMHDARAALRSGPGRTRRQHRRVLSDAHPGFSRPWVYYHYRVRKPAVWTLFAVGVLVVGWAALRQGTFPLAALWPLLLLALATVFTYRLHQEVVFPAVDFRRWHRMRCGCPARRHATGPDRVPGVSKAYPLDYVIHHHIVNDRFGEATVSLTYCAMCRSIIPFDVTDIGPLFVGSFKNANMIVADRRTKTFFQQGTFSSIVGPLHPHTLNMISFQILSWADVKQLEPLPQVVDVTEKDLRPFELPIHGVWRRILASQATPGLRREDRDQSMPARTRVVGVLESAGRPSPVYVRTSCSSMAW